MNRSKSLNDSNSVCPYLVGPSLARLGVTAIWALLLGVNTCLAQPSSPSDSVTPANASIPAPANGAIAWTPLTLGQAALSAAQNHPDLKTAVAQWEQTIAGLKGSRANYFPRINGSVGFTYNESQSALTGGSTVVRVGGTRNYNVGLTLTQRLWDFGQTRTAVEAASKSVEASEFDLDGRRQDLLLNVATQYFNVLRQHQDVLINQDNLRNAQVQVERARGQVEAGVKAKIEVTRAESDLANAQLSLIQAQNSELKFRAALSTSMGDSKLQDYQVEDLTLEIPALTQEEALQIASKTRPDLKALNTRYEIAQINIQNRQAQYWPTLQANAGYSWSDRYFLPEFYSWNVGVSLSIPIFNEPTLSSQVESAQAAARVAEAQLESGALNARQSVVESYLNLVGARSKHDASMLGLTSAQENYRLASERYKVGVGNSLEVSDAQRLLVQARSQELQARFDIHTAIIQLYRQLGKLDLEFLLAAVKPPVPRPNLQIPSAEPSAQPATPAEPPKKSSDSATPAKPAKGKR